MIKRCIMIFPHFENQQIIDNIRKKYDPLAKCVRPHISLSGITPSTLAGNYLFLNVKEGNAQIVEIHKRLYKGILKEFYPQWPKEIEFLPHMTVGNISDLNAFEMAVEETKNVDDVFETTVDTISVEIIDENEDSIIELNIPLNICK